MYMNLAAGRRRRTGGGGLAGPKNLGPPGLVEDFSSNQYIYVTGTWEGTPSVVARIFIGGVDTAPATVFIPIQSAWRGHSIQIRETATDPDTGAFSVAVSAVLYVPLTPEEAIVALFATKRLGYVIDAGDKSTMLQNGSVPVTANGQLLARVDPKLKSAVTPIAWTQTTAGSQPQWIDDAIVPDGVADVLLFPSGGTAVQPDFGNLAGFVACLLVTPGVLQAQTFWTVGFGGTAANFRLRIHGAANGSVVFSAHDGVARRDFTTAAGLLVPGTPITLTLFVDFQTREAKGFVDGVERASFTLLNVGDIVNMDSNRCYLFRGHGTAIEFSNSRLHRAAFLHDRTDAAGRITIESWVNEFPPPVIVPAPVAEGDWERPIDASDLPPVGALRSHNGQIWENIIATGNLGEPGIFYGWEAVT